MSAGMWPGYIGLGYTREAYESWRRGGEATKAFWERKAQLARDMLAEPHIQSSVDARKWFETSLEVCTHNQRWGARFDLLMLLRTRAAGALG